MGVSRFEKWLNSQGWVRTDRGFGWAHPEHSSTETFENAVEDAFERQGKQLEEAVDTVKKMAYGHNRYAGEIEAKLLEAQAKNEKFKSLLKEFVDKEDDECWVDHTGFCQAHFCGTPCLVAEAKQWLGIAHTINKVEEHPQHGPEGAD